MRTHALRMTRCDAFEPTPTTVTTALSEGGLAPECSVERVRATVRELVIELARIAAAEDDEAERRRDIASPC